ncbi:MAG: hypothetical protein JWL99_3745 [Streptomyces oryziradicis]|nr:hypothetical protein [Actinacidiphila oryziradicis]
MRPRPPTASFPWGGSIAKAAHGRWARWRGAGRDGVPPGGIADQLSGTRRSPPYRRGSGPPVALTAGQSHATREPCPTGGTGTRLTGSCRARSLTPRGGTRPGQAARLKGLDAGITAGTVPRRWHAGSRRPAALRDRRAEPAADAAAGRVPSKIIRPPLTWPGGRDAAPAARQIQVVDGSARAVRAGEADARPLRPEQGATTIAATPCSEANPRSPAPTTLRVNTPSRWNGRRTRSRRWPPACCRRRRRPSG